MKIGFIGLGIMGKPMSKNLIKAGHELVVYNRSKASVEELEAFGAQWRQRGQTPCHLSILSWAQASTSRSVASTSPSALAV